MPETKPAISVLPKCPKCGSPTMILRSGLLCTKRECRHVIQQGKPIKVEHPVRPKPKDPPATPRPEDQLRRPPR